MFAYNLDHVAIAVRDLDEALSEYKRLYGSEPLYRELVPEQGVEEAMVAVGGSFIQLLQPLSPDSPVGRFISRRGEDFITLPWRLRISTLHWNIFGLREPI